MLITGHNNLYRVPNRSILCIGIHILNLEIARPFLFSPNLVVTLAVAFKRSYLVFGISPELDK